MKQHLVTAEIRFLVNADSETECKIQSALAMVHAASEMEDNKNYSRKSPPNIKVVGSEILCVTEEK